MYRRTCPEIAIPAATLEAKADSQARWYLSMLSRGVKKVFLYCYGTKGNWMGRWMAFGPDGRLTPGATALSCMMYHLEGKDYIKTVPIGGGVHAYLFYGDTDIVAVVSGEPNGRKTIAECPTGLAAKGLFGNDCRFPLSVGDTLVYFSGHGMTLEKMERALAALSPDNDNG